MTVWIAQCLCPQRHCIMATAGQADDLRAATLKLLDPLRDAVGDALRADAINPWCGLCNARQETWRYELGRTRFATMAEARPALLESEANQAITRAVFGDMKRSD
jgi:hypothetical protein